MIVETRLGVVQAVHARRISFVVTLLLPVLVGAVDPASARETRPHKIVVPSNDFPTIQRGIEAALDGGTVLIRPGVYEETLLVVGKEITLQGSGARGEERTVVIGPDRDRGTLTFGPAGGGTVKSMVITGGAYGVASEDGLPAAVEIRDAVIENTGRGVFGTYSDLTMKAVTVQNTSWNGISLVGVDGMLTMSDTHVLPGGNVGLLILNHKEGPETIHIDQATILGHPGGGIVVNGDGKDVEITDSLIAGNSYAGVRFMFSGHNLIQDTIINTTHPRPADGFYGDGVMAICSDVMVLGSNPVPDPPELPISGSNLIEFSARAGISAFGSSMSVGNTLFNSNPIDLNTEPFPCGPGPDPIPSVLDDLMGNLCGSFKPDGFDDVLCQNKSVNLVPPDAIDTP